MQKLDMKHEVNNLDNMKLHVVIALIMEGVKSIDKQGTYSKCLFQGYLYTVVLNQSKHGYDIVK